MAAAIEQFQKSETSPTCVPHDSSAPYNALPPRHAFTTLPCRGRPSGDAEHNVSRFDTAELMVGVLPSRGIAVTGVSLGCAVLVGSV